MISSACGRVDVECQLWNTPSPQDPEQRQKVEISGETRASIVDQRRRGMGGGYMFLTASDGQIGPKKTRDDGGQTSEEQFW